MSKLVFRLRHVPADEADEVRELLAQHEIEYFETFAGNWGISLPALWVKDTAQFEQARALIDGYQEARRLRVRQEFEQSRERGERRTLWHSFIDDPVQFLLYVGLAGLILYFSVRVFLSF